MERLPFPVDVPGEYATARVREGRVTAILRALLAVATGISIADDLP